MSIILERFMKELDQLKRDTDSGVVRMQDYDAKLAGIIKDLRERGHDADRVEATAALARALKHGVITARLGLE